MSIFRSYFSKNNTIIQDTETNSARNPVTELSYGGVDRKASRFIFDINFNPLLEKIQKGEINPNNITKHILRMTNTIRYAPEYIGKSSYDSTLKRASGFGLELFNIDEEWVEGVGYDLNIGEQFSFDINNEPSNWIYKRNDGVKVPWDNEGVYLSGSTTIVGGMFFELGNEDIYIDITEYVNDRIITLDEVSYGLGLKFSDEYENLKTIYKQVVSFHTKYTNTYYEPYLETHIDDIILDDRNYFTQNKENRLYFISNNKNIENVEIESVEIFDHNDILHTTLIGNTINKVTDTQYYVNLEISSDEYPDAIIFRDDWNFKINNKIKKFSDYFYLIDESRYLGINTSSVIEHDNYCFCLWGVWENEKIRAGDVRNIEISIKKLYDDQNNNYPMDIEYRLFTSVGDKYEIDIIPYTKVNRIKNQYSFTLDTSWLIPQDYRLQVRLNNNGYYKNKKTINFTVTNSKI